MIRNKLVATVAVAILSPGLADAAPPLAGVWGGDQAILTLTQDGGTLTAGCAQGRLNGPVSLDAHSRFTAAGVLDATAQAGPQRADLRPQTESAQFTGAVEGETLRLTVRSDAGERTYVLTRGARPKIIRCL